MTKKKESKKEAEPVTEVDVVNETEAVMAQLQSNLQIVVNKANEYAALCNHYEMTINILTGRVQELQQALTQAQQK
nr:hypothetical protein [bacterium]